MLRIERRFSSPLSASTERSRPAVAPAATLTMVPTVTPTATPCVSKAPALARVALLAWLACSVLACKDSGGPPLPGICGLEGTRVWCYEDSDCYEYAGSRCDHLGQCQNDKPPPCGDEQISGAFGPFGGCLQDKVCTSSGDCKVYCRTHDDCGEGAECRCGGPLPDLGYCWSGRCEERDGGWRCPEGTEPTKGSLTCHVPNREGVCHGCGEGYVRVGEVGCEPLFDCGNGVLEAGEDCDGTDLGGASCYSIGLSWEEHDPRLRCRDDCSFDVQSCYGEVVILPGQICEAAADITGEPFPFVLEGPYDWDGEGGSCAPYSYNSVFYVFTPPSTGAYRIITVNWTGTAAHTIIAVYEGTTCSPLGPEVACGRWSARTGSAVVDLDATQTYLIQVYTDEDIFTMVDPEITVSPFPGPGESCSTAVDISSVSFPYQLAGVFDWQGEGGSCDQTASNAVFYVYTPPTSGSYEIHAQNTTSDFAFSRLAIFEGSSCSPYGQEVLCELSMARDVSTTVSLVGGANYLIQFYTDGQNFPMVGPVISITP